MELDIIKTVKNPLLERTEIEFKIVQSGATPREDVVLKELVSKLKVKAEQIVIDTIHQVYGKMESTGTASVYDKTVRDAPVVEGVEATEEAKPEETKAE
ncbi:MAG: 30S ribosomal protein S24e [DPANN group archaeon]|nr:30S ribosomal protein S24e [DPANN group archaeon]